VPTVFRLSGPFPVSMDRCSAQPFRVPHVAYSGMIARVQVGRVESTDEGHLYRGKQYV